MGRVIKIRLRVEEQQELEALVGRPTEEAGLVRRARVPRYLRFLYFLRRGISICAFSPHAFIGAATRCGFVKRRGRI